MIADAESAEVDLEKRRGRRGDPEEVRRGRQQERVRKLASGDGGKWLGRKRNTGLTKEPHGGTVEKSQKDKTRLHPIGRDLRRPSLELLFSRGGLFVALRQKKYTPARRKEGGKR